MSGGIAYYNEFNEEAAQWLRFLIHAGQIAPGVVDTRSIEDVQPSDLRGFTQVHFFAGIGVWSYALRRAGWSDDRPIWTGSCPCQPFSAAGVGLGFADERHLWPAFFHLIDQCRPAIVLGEQVASKDADAWIDLVCADVEALGYAFGAVPFPSAGVGAPHIRDRLYWLAQSEHGGRKTREQEWSRAGAVVPSGVDGRMADATSSGRGEECSDDRGCAVGNRAQGVAAGLEHGSSDHRPGPVNGYWRSADWLGCRDGKWRPVSAPTLALADGTTPDLGRVRGARLSQPTEAKEIDELRTLLEAPDAEAFHDGHSGIPIDAEASQVLQQGLHVEGDAEGCMPLGQSLAKQGAPDHDDVLLGLWDEFTRTACASQERGPLRQQVVELDDALRQLPPGGPLPELLGTGCAEKLHSLFRADGEVRALLNPLVAAEAVWRSLGEEAKGRARVGFAAANFRWQMASPLSAGEPARAMRLRGYGNAINAEAARVFIEAVMESI